MTHEKKHIGIIGSGRFTETLLRLFGNDFAIIVCGRNDASLRALKKKHAVRITKDLKDMAACDAVIFAVPISALQEVLSRYAPLAPQTQTLIDVLSIKSYPKRVFKKIMKGRHSNILLTHPLFGPDSSKKGFKGLPIMIDDSMCNGKEAGFWTSYFKKKDLKIVPLSSEEHDKLAARSQGLAHFIGRVLEDFNIESSPIDTLGAKKLMEIKEQTCSDTRELFSDLQHYNPYTKAMRTSLGKSFDRIFNALLPKRSDNRFITFGIQGAEGSFCEQAAFEYIKNKGIKNPSLKYLYTSEKVLNELHKGNIDFGLCALHNSHGGVVEETLYAVARHRCDIVEEFSIRVRHFLMKRKDIPSEKISSIMAHPQVFKQCRHTLAKLYPELTTISGAGDLVDTARAAQALSTGEISKTYAILGSRSIADLYNFDIIGEDLQDDKDNHTSFVVLKRAH
ncbi:MAG: prephenate dehydrogenase/arogenate dehydrogenase family protein [Patescibacteria group bacterium]